MSVPLALEEAWDRLFALAPRLGAETVPVGEAAGRYLAADLQARRTSPARDVSAMDGFAVAGPGPWRVIGESRAGVPFAGAIGPGEAVRISTGAACPDGTVGIVLVEDSKVEDDVLSAAPPSPGGHIRRCGFDFAEGEVLLLKGARIGPAQIALALAGGHARVEVARQPRIAVIECGDELSADAETPGANRVPASNGAMVCAMARGLVAGSRRIGPLADDRATLASTLRSAATADVIVTTAGASVGAHDHVRGALEDCGAELAFWRVAIRPGKPLLVARMGDSLVLGLPGNPNSSFVTAFLFLLPLLRAMQGALEAEPQALHLPLAAGLPEGGARREFWRAQLDRGAARPLPERDSSALRTLGWANLLIDRPAHAPSAGAGELLRCYSLENGGMA